MNCSDSRKESFMPDGGMLNKLCSQGGRRKYLMLQMHLVCLLRRIPPMVSQLQDLWNETQIGLFTMSTQRDGFNAGLCSVESQLFVSGSILQISTLS